MKKTISILVFCSFCMIFCAQSIETYPTSQRYLFNPYDTSASFFDSVNFCISIWSMGWEMNNLYDDIGNVYQMYAVAPSDPVQVYGVAIPLALEMPYPRHSKNISTIYWNIGPLGPHDDSVRNMCWQLFIDSMHYIYKDTSINGIKVRGRLLEYEKFIYLIEKFDDTLHPIRITDSVKINYGINAVGWNLMQRPKCFECPPPPNPQCGFLVPTLEIYFDHGHTLIDTFFVGNTSFCSSYFNRSDNNWYESAYWTWINYLYNYPEQPEHSFLGAFHSVDGDFYPETTNSFTEYTQVRYPGEINSNRFFYKWGGPMAILTPPPCMVPHDVRMTQVGHDSATVEFDIPVAVSHCRLEYGPQGFAPGSGTVVNGLTTGSYCIHGLREGTDYEVRVAAWCIYADSLSEEVSVTFTTQYACAPVEDILGCATTDSTITLLWWMPDSASYTEVVYGSPGFADDEGVQLPNVSRGYYGYGTVTIFGLEPHTQYEIRLRNYCANSDMMSEWLVFDTATTGTTQTEALQTPVAELIIVKPNPATTNVTVSAPMTINRVIVSDIKGRIVLDRTVSAGSVNLDTSTWPRGALLVTVQTAQGFATKKLTLK